MFQRFEEIGGYGIGDRLELLVVGDADIWLEVVGGKSKLNAQSLIAKYTLFFAVDRVGELRLELVNLLRSFRTRLNER